MQITSKAIYLITLLFVSVTISAQSPISEEKKADLESYLNEFGKRYTSPRKITIETIKKERKTLNIYANAALEDIPFREENVELLYKELKSFFPEEKQIKLFTRDTPVESLIPEYYKTNKINKDKVFPVKHKGAPLTLNISTPHNASKGLQNRHISIWQSHGLYYTQATRRWEWQRARLFGTVEDLYTQSYVLPFLVPMLENAGANVLIPRERDTNTIEIIIDNDGSAHGTTYTEINGDQEWRPTGLPGFAHNKEIYTNGENPFRIGTFRQATTQKRADNSASILWSALIPESNEYAVYVSYHTLPNSTDDAIYTIHHGDGTSKTSFSVNQKMGGGTWVYLGHFYFEKGAEAKVELSNNSSRNGKIVTADAVKIGGGMGNIARNPLSPPFPIEEEISGYPRFIEASRYWLQWAGMPDSIYSHTKFENDYTDDIYARGKWVNYLKEYQNIPIDISLAFHSDAGITPDDSIIGTLGIYMSKNDDGRYKNKKSRETARDLTDLVQSQIVDDIRAEYNPNWSRRGMWNQSYIEARIPDVPSMLLELLSHQNFADMKYGLDPRFRFTVSRAIYKGMLRYICMQNNQPYIVQPLAPDYLHAQFTGSHEVTLAWEPVHDQLEPTASPTSYIVYTRTDGGAFDNGIATKNNSLKMQISPGTIYSFKVVAVNDGGRSFPSEIISAFRAPQEHGTVLIVNGFDRISGPESFEARRDSLAGFLYQEDRGVPYLKDISFVGDQYEFRRSAEWVTNDNNGHGDCYNDMAGNVIAGNTFDFPYTHGKAIAQAGYSFVSSGLKAICANKVNLSDYKITDLILGKQKRTIIGKDSAKIDYPAFPEKLKETLKTYCANNGKLFISGAYIMSDLLTEGAESISFAAEVLKSKHASSYASRTGKVKGVASPYPYFKGEYNFHVTPNRENYSVEKADALLPANEKAHILLKYPENNMAAAIGFKSDYSIFVMGFPFETIKTEADRSDLMKDILNFLD